MGRPTVNGILPSVEPRESEAIVHCSECRQLIVPGEWFVRFKVPGKGIYECFHRRFNPEDCWESRLRQRIETLFDFGGDVYGRSEVLLEL
jgi:hypothetical protein